MDNDNCGSYKSCNNFSKWENIFMVAVTNAIIVVVIAGGLKAFKFQENWISYRTTCELLKKEYIYYNSKTKDYKNSEDPESLFIERVEELISRENTFWVSAYKKESTG